MSVVWYQRSTLLRNGIVSSDPHFIGNRNEYRVASETRSNACNQHIRRDSCTFLTITICIELYVNKTNCLSGSTPDFTPSFQ